MGPVAPVSAQVRQTYHDGKYFVVDTDGKEYETGTLGALCAGRPKPVLPPKEVPPEDQIDEQRDLIIQRTTHLLTIQFLFEKCYGFTPKHLRKEENRYLLDGQTNNSNYPIYTKMLESAKNRTETELTKITQTSLSEKERQDKISEITGKHLKEVFVEKIHQMNAKKIEKLRAATFSDPDWPLRSLFSSAKTNIQIFSFRAQSIGLELLTEIVYFISNTIIHIFVKKLISTHINMLKDYMKKNENDNYCEFKNDMINNLTRCLTTLNGAYTAISKKDGMGTISERIAKELRQPYSNQGRNPDALYQEFAKTLITSTAGKVKGSLAAWILQRFIKPGAIVESLVQTIAASSKDNKGYSHPIKMLLLEQLKQVEILLDNPKNSSASRPVSEERKIQLSSIINQVLELLDKSECPSIDEIRRTVKGTGFHFRHIFRHIETAEMAILMNTLVLMISDLIESNVNKDQFASVTLKLMKLTNDCFMPMKQFNEKVMAKTEKTLEETTKKILRKSVDLGIDRFFTDCLTGNEEANSIIQGTYKKYLWIPIKLIGKMVIAPTARWAAKEFFVVSTATKKMNGLYRIITERNVYLCALHHLALIPHLEAMNKKKP